ncbi:polyribonucleotide nucleotidyltransferase [Wolbachia endosymbiont of Pentidionis agamae]|uniref:polyribonucleotide nucleotidyltransferase n=1 Tax=Wolbachia endosymbiont of Pentidionis agamae TaxID=3110435 RepID=UPI002FD5781B
MFKVINKSMEWANRSLVIETGKMARQANGSVVVSYGGTSILATVVHKRKDEYIDFLPLNVQFIAKSYSVGKIPGGFFKREGKPSERETLISRLVDRSIRPIFHDGFNDDVSVVCNLLTYDLANVPEVPALIGAVVALAISGIPLRSLVAGVMVGCDENNNYVLNPLAHEVKESVLDLFLSSDKDSIFMVESQAHEFSEEGMLDAMKFGHESLQSVLAFMEDFIQCTGNNSGVFTPSDMTSFTEEFEKSSQDFKEAYSKENKKERTRALEDLRGKIISHFREKGKDEQLVAYALKGFEKSLVCKNIKKNGIRIDGRKYNDIRPIEAEVDILHKTHGSSLFTRGHTQALAVTALGTVQDEQVIDDIDGGREHFMLHYNFPSFAIGEISTTRAPGRREIGHGKLAWKAIYPVLPDKSDFPYTIRVVSEIMESDGSSSMATVCAASLALMDTGVPIKAQVAGIAMGLIGGKDDDYMVLSDILGEEDYLGDMDFKVAGTSVGITALQMDMKISGISFKVIRESLMQAREGRLHILNIMNSVISNHNSSIKDHAPKVLSFYIDKGKISNVIGSKGKNIRYICEQSNSKVEIDDDGKVSIFATNDTESELARSMVFDSITEIREGSLCTVKIIEVGKSTVIVELSNGKRGLIHISEIANEHIESIDEILSCGDIIKALVIGFERGYIKLSRRKVDQETGELFEGELYTPQKNSNYRGSPLNKRSGFNERSGFNGRKGLRTGSRDRNYSKENNSGNYPRGNRHNFY